MRQTDFTLPELLERIESGESNLPVCLLVNEIGEMGQAGDQQALEELAKMLTHANGDLRAPSYAWLCRIGADGFGRRLVEFAARFENEDIVLWARDVYGLVPPS